MNPRLLIPLALVMFVALSFNSTASANQKISADFFQTTSAPLVTSPDTLIFFVPWSGHLPQMWEVDRDCIREVLGYLPESLSELPEQEREQVLQDCGKIVEMTEDGSIVNVGLEHSPVSDQVAGTAATYLQELDSLDRHWQDKIDQVTQEWTAQLDLLDQEYADQDRIWSREYQSRQAGFTDELRLIDGKIAALEQQWAADSERIRQQIDQEQDQILSTNLQRQLRAGRIEFELQKQELETQRFDVNQDMGVELEKLELTWTEELAGIDLRREMLAQARAEEIDLLKKDWSAEQARLKSGFETTIEQQSNQVQAATTGLNAGAGTGINSVDSLRGFQRGFFLNQESAAVGSFQYGSLDPSTLAVIGILVTLGTAVLTLVRGR